MKTFNLEQVGVWVADSATDDESIRFKKRLKQKPGEALPNFLGRKIVVKCNTAELTKWNTTWRRKDKNKKQFPPDLQRKTINTISSIDAMTHDKKCQYQGWTTYIVYRA